MTDLVFTSGVRRPEPLSFELDGETYTLLPAKEAINVLEGWSTWLFTGLNAYDWSVLDDAAKSEILGPDAVMKLSLASATARATASCAVVDIVKVRRARLQWAGLG